MTPPPSRLTRLPLPGCDEAEALVATEPEARFALHAHPEWSVGAILAGACEFACEGRAYRAAAGDLIVMAPHALHTAGVSAGRFEMVMLYLPQRWVASTLGWPLAPPAWCCATWHDARLSADLAEGVSQGGGLPVAQLPRVLTHAAGQAGPGPARRPADPRVDALRAWLREDDSPAPDLAALARRLGWSREHAHRVFRAAVGMTPGHYARLARIARAKALLRGGVPPVEAAAACGFADQAHFVRWFRRCFGVTPSRYRSVA